MAEKKTANSGVKKTVVKKAVVVEETATDLLAKNVGAEFVIPPFDLPVAKQMRASVLLGGLQDIAGDGVNPFEDDSLDIATFAQLMAVCADVYEWVCENAAEDSAALDKSFKGDLSAAMEFAFLYVSAVGELLNSADE